MLDKHTEIVRSKDYQLVPFINSSAVIWLHVDPALISDCHQLNIVPLNMC